MSTCSVVPQAKALKERREAIATRTANAQGYADFVRARYASLTNDPRQAATYYGEAARANPYDPDLLERAVFTALISGATAQATALAEAAQSETLAASSLPRITLGVDRLKNGKARRAESILLPETTSLFNDAIARNLIAWSMVSSGKTEEALSIVSTQKTNDKLFASTTMSTHALIHLHLGNDEDALQTLEEMWQNNMRLASTTEYHARLLAQKGDRAKAARILRQFSSRVGQNPAIEALRANLANETSPIPLIRPSLTQGAALSIYIPAASLAAQTRNDLPGVYFALALALDPDLHIARTLWADALDTANRREDAIALLAEVPDSSLFYATARGQIAWAQRREGDNEAALKTARQALAYAEDRNLKIQLGDLFRSLDQLEQAERIFAEIIKKDMESQTEDWRILYARGAALEQLDRWEEAEADLIRANDISPNRPALMNYLGYSWIDRGVNLEEGFDLIERAVALRPNAGFIVDSLGWAHYKLGNYDEAVKHLERAVELSPTDPMLNDHLGDAYWRAGRKREAGFQWTRTIRLDPESEDITLLEAKREKGLERALALYSAQNQTGRSPAD